MGKSIWKVTYSDRIDLSRECFEWLEAKGWIDDHYKINLIDKEDILKEISECEDEDLKHELNILLEELDEDEVYEVD